MNAIKQIRQALSMSQDAMAAALGCTQGAISSYEVGRNDPTPDTARQIIEMAKARGLSVGYDHVYGAKPVPRVRRIKPPEPPEPAPEIEPARNVATAEQPAAAAGA